LGLAIGSEALQTGVALLLWISATQLVVAALLPDPWLIWLLSALELLLALATGYLMIARGPLWMGGQEAQE
jgi:Na+-driven multidrug efflux pump